MYEFAQKIRAFLRSEIVTGAHIGQLSALLTLTTLFTLVPLVTAVSWGLASLPAYQEVLFAEFEAWLTYLVPTEASIWRSKASELTADVANLQWLSISMLFLSLLVLVNQVDRSLHWVFQVSQRRTPRRWFVYVWVMPILMVFLVLMMTLLVLFQILLGTGLVRLMPNANLVTVPVTWITLFIIYKFSSRNSISDRMNLGVAFFVTAGFFILKNVFAWLYVTLPNWSIVFGVFSAIPLFLLWCQAAWSMVLYGALILRWLSR